MRKSLIARAAATATGAIALAGLAPVAAATAATTTSPTTTITPRHSTSLSIRASRYRIHPGASVVVGGTLRSGRNALPGETITLEDRSMGGKFAVDATSVTNAQGRVGFTVTPDQWKQYKLVFTGSSTLRGTHSGVVTVRVSRFPTSLSIREAKTKISVGGTDTISGVLLSGRDPLAREQVELLRRVDGGKWNLANAGFTGPNGGISFVVKPGRSKHFMLEFFGSSTFAPTHSGVVTVVIR